MHEQYSEGLGDRGEHTQELPIQERSSKTVRDGLNTEFDLDLALLPFQLALCGLLGVRGGGREGVHHADHLCNIARLHNLTIVFVRRVQHVGA